MKIAVIFFVISISLLACNSSDKTGKGPSTDSLNYEQIVMMQSLNGCDKDEHNCTYIEFSYPQFTNMSGALADSTKNIMNNLFANPEKKITSFDSTQQAFLADYKNFKKEQKNYSIPWTVEKSVTVFDQNPKWLTLEIKEALFTGGAHSNEYTLYRMLDKETGRQLLLTDFFDTISIYKLTALGEPLFCAEKGISPSQGLEEAGFWFPNNHFQLNNNFYMSEKGITFLYNPYEIGPYVKGTSTITIPANEFVKWMKPYKLLR